MPLVLFLLLCLPGRLLAQDPDSTTSAPPALLDDGPFFYQGLPYGNDAYTGPLDIILNTGYSLAQTDRHSREVLTYSYGFRHVRNSLLHPVRAIERGGGWWDFVRKEMLPLSIKKDDVKWYTNYTGHIIEGGIRTRRMQEWYTAHRVPLPGLMAGATTMAAAFLNELYEHPNDTAGVAGTVADLYFFDMAGIVVFSFDGVARFFARRVHANVWTGQASFAYPSGEIQNNGNYLYAKSPWRVIGNASLFYWTGMGAGIGLTFHRSDGLDVSVAVGRDAKRMSVDPVTGEESADLSSYATTLFVDRNESLLFSVHLSQVQHRLLKINVFPGTLPLLGQFGAWAVVTHDFQFRFGISHSGWLGAGVGLGW